MKTTSPYKKEIPQVSRWESLRTASRFLKNPINVISETIEKYGDTYAFYLGGLESGLLTANANVIQAMLQKEHRKFKKTYIQTDLLGQYIGWGLLTSDGDFWLRQRRLIQPGFHKQKLKGLAGIMQEEIKEATAHFDQYAASGETFDIYHEMMNLAFRIVGRSFFSTSIDQKNLQVLEKGITEIQAFVVKQVRQPFFYPWYKLSGQINKYKQQAKDMKKLFGEVIEERKTSNENFDDLLDMLLSTRYEDTGEAMSTEQLLDESIIIFVAGHETTANALTWTLHLLSKHPEAVDKIRAECASLNGAMPSFQELMQLPYTKQVIEESMRLYPPAWITDREAIEDVEIDGFKIKKGTVMVGFIYGAHHSKKYWEAPEEFRPERFEKGKSRERHPFSYLPFGGGPRLCIGNNFAMMEMQMIVAYLIQKFDFTTLKDQEIDLNPLVTLRPRFGIKMKVNERV